jgi:hypothetical protein
MLPKKALRQRVMLLVLLLLMESSPPLRDQRLMLSYLLLKKRKRTTPRHSMSILLSWQPSELKSEQRRRLELLMPAT